MFKIKKLKFVKRAQLFDRNVCFYGNQSLFFLNIIFNIYFFLNIPSNHHHHHQVAYCYCLRSCVEFNCVRVFWILILSMIQFSGITISDVTISGIWEWAGFDLIFIWPFLLLYNESKIVRLFYYANKSDFFFVILLCWCYVNVNVIFPERRLYWNFTC